MEKQLNFTLYNVFIEKDCSIVEINQLVTTGDGQVLALDAKLNFDDNALFRHKRYFRITRFRRRRSKEIEASKYDLSYIALDGMLVVWLMAQV